MTDDWYKAMGAAIAKRDRAVTMRDKWEGSIRAAEENIAQLAALREGGEEIATKIIQDPVDEDLANDDEDE